MAGHPSSTARDVLAEALKTLPAVTVWSYPTDEAAARLRENGGEPIDGRGEWMWTVVRYAIPDSHGGGYGFGGAATRAEPPTLLRLPPDAAKAAWDRGQEVLAAASKR